MSEMAPVAFRYRKKDIPEMDWRYSAIDMSGGTYICEPLYSAATVNERGGGDIEAARYDIESLIEEYAAASVAIGRRGDEDESLADQIKQVIAALNERCAYYERLHALNLGWEIRARAAEAEVERLRSEMAAIADMSDCHFACDVARAALTQTSASTFDAEV